MTRVHVLIVALSIVCVSACGDPNTSADRNDGAAVAACRSVLAQVARPELLATTVREEGPGYMVSAWTSGRAEGTPDYLCQVARDRHAERGVAVVRIQGQDGSGAYRSTLDIEFDGK